MTSEDGRAMPGRRRTAVFFESLIRHRRIRDSKTAARGPTAPAADDFVSRHEQEYQTAVRTTPGDRRATKDAVLAVTNSAIRNGEISVADVPAIVAVLRHRADEISHALSSPPGAGGWYPQPRSRVRRVWRYLTRRRPWDRQ